MSHFKYVRVLNICKLLQIWQGSEDALGGNYGGVLNVPGFLVCQVSAYARVAQSSEYSWIMSCGRVLNMSGQRFTVFYICPQSKHAKAQQNMTWVWICELHRVLSMPDTARICLNNVSIYVNVLITLNIIEYTDIIPEKTECGICRNSECVWCST